MSEDLDPNPTLKRTSDVATFRAADVIAAEDRTHHAAHPDHITEARLGAVNAAIAPRERGAAVRHGASATPNVARADLPHPHDLTDPSMPLVGPDSAAFEPGFGRILAERYRLLRSLGQGGMGLVWLAEVIGTQHPVALKWLSDESARDAEIRARFRREIRASLAIRHEGVIHGLDLDRLEDGRDMLVMEYVEGATLEAVLSERERLTPKEVVHIGRKLAAALAATHDAGFIHRDLKPSNMIVSGDGPLTHATVRLLDLGVCHDETEHQALSLTAHYGGVLGTPSYMAPEQLVGAAVTIRSDVFSLGVVLYRMIAGHKPYPGSTFAELTFAVSSMDPAALSDVCPDPNRPTELDELVHAMLAFQPENRPASAHEVAQALEDIADPRRSLRRVAFVIVASLALAFFVGWSMGTL